MLGRINITPIRDISTDVGIFPKIDNWPLLAFVLWCRHFQVESIDNQPDGTYEVTFYIYDADTGVRYPAAEAELVYERIDRGELSSYVGAFVSQQDYFLKQCL